MKVENGSLIMTYRDYINEIPLPNMELEIKEEQARRVAGEAQVTGAGAGQVARRMTRAQTVAAKAATRAQAEQNVRDALNQWGVPQPSQWGAWPITPPSSQEAGGSH